MVEIGLGVGGVGSVDEVMLGGSDGMEVQT